MIPKKAVASFLAYLGLLLAIPFLVAGKLAWWGMWALVGISVITGLGSRLIVLRRFPDLALERAGAAQAEGVEPWDRILMPLVAVVGPLLTLLVAALDVRFGWSQGFPLPVEVGGLTLAAAGSALGTWAMVVNRFFSAVVRIQSDRGHVVVTSGPYRWVRHPAYAGGILANIGWPLLLSSRWAFLPAVLTALATMARTWLEDRTLLAGLPGYQEYARCTRHRLLPGVW